jgi:transposase
LTTKIHLASASENQALAVLLGPGHEADCSRFSQIYSQATAHAEVDAAVMDKAYDSDDIRREVLESGARPVVPPRSNRNHQYRYDKELYKERNRVERHVSKIKQYRRIATRYDKLARCFLASVHLVLALVCL